MLGAAFARCDEQDYATAKASCSSTERRLLHEQGLPPLSTGRPWRRPEARDMITRSQDFDLGRDRTRIKDPRDAARQQCTVDALLDRFFNPRSLDRFEIQVVADEVGMGKTFVALGAAYSI